MKYYYINTDSTELEDSPHGEWIEYDRAFTSGAPRNHPDFQRDYEQYGEQHLGRLEQGDICFMYVNGYGVVAIGRVAACWDRDVYEGNDRLIYKDTDATEYRICVNWFLTLVNYPVSIEELRAIFNWPPHGWPWQSTLDAITDTDAAESLLDLAKRREPESIQRGIREVITKIEKKSANGDYIYRGEPDKHYEKVSSTLYRPYAKEIDAEQIDIKAVQQEMLKQAKRYVRGMDDQEILTQLQHYGGETNLIDFTNDYLISLFFACDGVTSRGGRVILLKKTRIKNDDIEEPQSLINRVRDQKSVFVSPPKGFIEREQYETVDVPKYLKQALLVHLEKYHHISTTTIYNDLHGFLRVRHLHYGAAAEFNMGLTCHRRRKYDEAVEHYTKAIELSRTYIIAYNNRGAAYHEQGKDDLAIADCTRAIELDSGHTYAYHNRGLAYIKKRDYTHAIADFTQAIQLDPHDADDYNNRGYVYRAIGEYERAKVDLTKAIELNSNHFRAYANRGIARLHLDEFKEAKSDLWTAKQNGVSVIDLFNATYGSIAKFQNGTGIMLPESIVEVLTSASS